MSVLEKTDHNSLKVLLDGFNWFKAGLPGPP